MSSGVAYSKSNDSKNKTSKSSSKKKSAKNLNKKEKVKNNPQKKAKEAKANNLKTQKKNEKSTSKKSQFILNDEDKANEEIAQKSKIEKSDSSENRSAKIAQNLQEAQFYFLLDADTKEVLLAKNPDSRIPPSSMTKVMTAYVVFDQVKKGRIRLDNQCVVGKDAWKKYGSSMFLNYGDIVTIDELVSGLLAVSGNDAAIALAESTAGGIDKFVDLMNQKAQELGLTNSHFKNPHGLFEEDHYMSVRDLATLTSRIYQDFPQYSHYLGIQEFTYRHITQRNRNPLIKGNYEGVLGGKTGHTDAGGYGVVAAAKRDDRMLIAVVNKVPTPKKRAALIFDLMDYGFDNFNKLSLFSKNQPVAKVKTWLGAKSKINAVVDRDIAISVPHGKNDQDVKVKLQYKEPLYAPIAKGDNIGTMKIEVQGYKNFEYPIYAEESVEKAGYLKRIVQITRYKISGITQFFNNNK